MGWETHFDFHIILKWICWYVGVSNIPVNAAPPIPQSSFLHNPIALSTPSLTCSSVMLEAGVKMCSTVALTSFELLVDQRVAPAALGL